MTQRPVEHHRRAGATLLIVLVLVAIVSVLLVTYMETVRFERTTTQNYSEELSADQIARGGLDRQVIDLDQEIMAGSTALPGPTPTSPTYYKPLSPLAMVPASYNDTEYVYTNVVRVSSSNSIAYQNAYPSTIYPGAVPVNLAVASSTATRSPDGRYLSAARWQAPQLLLPSETNAGTMPVPDWILMTRSGPTNAAGLTFGNTGNTLNNRVPSNPNYVVGRYAYIIYNEGGLLDANVAGAPNSGAGMPTADDIGNRGSLALAALTNSVLTPAQMTALSGWRNPATDASEPSYTNYVYNLGATNGFLQVQQGDNAFLSRQDLIAYANYAGMTNALPYLGTFNRAVNAPAYTPATATTLNPDLLTLRYANGGTINPVGTGTLLKSHIVQAGDFLLSRRFPLSRLSWVGYNGLANGASAYDVWRAFGLVWNGTVWVYVSGSGSSLPSASAVKTSIESLSDVSQENPPRDPDFFELLQAGILNGSLGQTSGAQSSYTDAAGNADLAGGSGDTSGFDSVQSYHLIQIGANIIDQARADNFSTAIEFGPDSRDKFVVLSPATSYGIRTFYGVKNLPYISRFIDTFVRFTTPPSPLSNSDVLPNSPFPGNSAFTYKQPFVGCWEQFELWNPHQAAPAGSGQAAALNPSAIRITAVGQLHGDVYSRNGSSASAAKVEEYSYIPTYAPSGTTLAAPTAANSETAWSSSSVYLQLSSAALANFSEPKLVANGDVASGTANCVQDGSNTVPGPGSPFVGLYVGSAYAPDWVYSAGNAGTKYPTVAPTSTNDPVCLTYGWGRINPYSPAGSTNPGVTYELQYQDPSSPNTWRTYSVVKNQTQTADSSFAVSTKTASSWTIQNSDSGGRFGQRIDPRTDRFSTSKAVYNKTGDPYANLVNAPPFINDTMRPDTGIGHSADACIPYGANIWLGNSSANTPPSPPGIFQPYYYLGGVAENTTSSPTYYKDTDGTLRRGDSAYDNSTTPDGHPGIQNALVTPNGINLARPVFLNRPFRSVGELGYVDRDLPWKTLDFFTKDSADAGLLDLFSVSDADVVAGTIDLNTRNASALAEVLGGEAINPTHVSDSSASLLSTAQANTLADALIAATKLRPLQSRAEMVTAALDPSSGETALTTDGFTAQSAKIQREAAVRTLSEVGNARTWNLLVDIIAQSGHYAQTLAPGASFDSFIPDGEKRYWLHVAIDRYTGKVVDLFLEPVQE